ncbi:terminal protein [Streptomyces coeruleorubidus]|uniref:Terminal protein n=1 Tax=Streptomyces coeruleorubidus TaxID=116188 RepID=A0A5J6IHQ9_STRC4|nr:terminal protein [Streptomyces coeruleorubidus]
MAAESLSEVFFRTTNTRANGLGVEFTDVETIEGAGRSDSNRRPPR